METLVTRRVFLDSLWKFSFIFRCSWLKRTKAKFRGKKKHNFETIEWVDINNYIAPLLSPVYLKYRFFLLISSRKRFLASDINMFSRILSFHYVLAYLRWEKCQVLSVANIRPISQAQTYIGLGAFRNFYVCQGTRTGDAIHRMENAASHTRFPMKTLFANGLVLPLHRASGRAQRRGSIGTLARSE